MLGRSVDYDFPLQAAARLRVALHKAAQSHFSRVAAITQACESPLWTTIAPDAWGDLLDNDEAPKTVTRPHELFRVR